MRTPRKRKFLIVPLLALGALIAAATPAAVAAPAAPVDDPAEHVVACDGGTQGRALVRLNDTPTPLVENLSWDLLPGASVPFVIPMGQTRQVIVIFTAESVLEGQPLTYAVPVDALRIRLRINNATIPPADNVIFTSGAGESNAVQACKRLPEGQYVVEADWWLDDVNANSVLTGTLNKWLLRVQINA